MANIRVNEGTQTYIATDTVGTAEYGIVKIDVGALGASSPFTGTLGAVTNLAGGSIVVTNGTVASVGTLPGVGVIGNVNGGSIVVTAGTITGGTISNIAGGSLVVTAGTVTTGTLAQVTAVNNLAGGSIVITAGTVGNILNAGTVQNQLGGTLNNILNAGTVQNQLGGTITTILTAGTVQNQLGGTITTVSNIVTGTLANSGTTTGVGVVGNVNGGSIVVTNGTVASVGTVPGVGIVGNVNAGSIVVTNGTVASVGTVPGIGVVGNINAGSVVVTGGTIGGNIANNGADSGNPVKVGGVYNTSAPTLDNGDRGDIQLDVNGYQYTRETYQPGYEDNVGSVAAITHRPVVSSSYGASFYSSYGTTTNISVKGSAGQLFAVTACNVGTGLLYIQLHNGTAGTIATGGTPVSGGVFALGSAPALAPNVRTIGQDYFGIGGMYFANGIQLGVSTTRGTFTAAGTADVTELNARYI